MKVFIEFLLEPQSLAYRGPLPHGSSRSLSSPDTLPLQEHQSSGWLRLHSDDSMTPLILGFHTRSHSEVQRTGISAFGSIEETILPTTQNKKKTPNYLNISKCHWNQIISKKKKKNHVTGTRRGIWTLQYHRTAKAVRQIVSNAKRCTHGFKWLY